jgi:hypothetical protein
MIDCAVLIAATRFMQATTPRAAKPEPSGNTGRREASAVPGSEKPRPIGWLWPRLSPVRDCQIPAYSGRMPCQRHRAQQEITIFGEGIGGHVRGNSEFTQSSIAIGEPTR